MKIGTVVLVIILILAASWTGLGYLISTSSRLQTENIQLQQGIQTLEMSLAKQQQENQKQQIQLSAITAELESAKSSLAEEKSAKEQALTEVRSCRINQSLSGLQKPTMEGAIFIPVAIGSILGTLGLGNWLRRKQTHQYAGDCQDPATDCVTVKLNRKQLHDFIKYQRQQK